MNSHVVYELSLLHISLLVYMLGGGGGMPVDLIMCILLKLKISTTIIRTHFFSY